MTLPDQAALRRTPEAPEVRDVLSPRLSRIGGWFTAGHWMSMLALVIVVIPPLLVIGPQVTHPGVYSNWGDVAANELSVQNAAHLHQAVGPYDRFGWFHPGPMLFYLLAIPYILMHWNGAAMQVGAALINLVAAVGIVGLVARRAGGRAALGTAAILCAFEFVRGVAYLPNAWGPEVIVLPAVLFFVLCADLAAGGVWSLVGAVVVGTFLVQTEIATGSAVVIGLGLAGCVRIVDWRVHGTLRPSLRNSRRAVLAALGVGAVLWAAPVWQQATNWPGNLGIVTNYFLRTNGHHSPGVAFSALAGGLLDPLPGLVGDRGIIHPTDAGLALLLVAIGVLAVICWLRRQWFACALAAGIFPVAAVCLLSLERVEAQIQPYLLLWMGALTLGAGIALVMSLTTPARTVPVLPTWGTRARFLGALLLAGCAVVSGWRLSSSASRAQAWGDYANVTSATATVEHVLPSHTRRMLVCVMSNAAWPTSAGVVADLRRDGRDARVNPHWLQVFGDELAPSGREQAAVFLDSTTNPVRSLPVKTEPATSSGGLTIRVFQPSDGHVSAAICPQVH